MRRRLLCLVAAAALAGCGAQRPATVRAVAVAIGSFGTGAATSAQTCNTRPWTECRQVALTGLVIALGVSLSAGAVAFLQQEEGEHGGGDGGGQ